MFILATLIFGAIALHELSVNLLPSVETPELLVRTEWNGASAHEVDHTVNEPPESYLSTVPGIHSIIQPFIQPSATFEITTGNAQLLSSFHSFFMGVSSEQSSLPFSTHRQALNFFP